MTPLAARPKRMAVYTTVYPAVAPFLPTWYASLQSQTDRDFELWVGLDGLAPADVSSLVGVDVEAQWVVAEPGDTPPSLRARAIDRMVGSCDAILFVDSDDVMFPTRVTSARSALERWDVAACALSIVDQYGAERGIVFGPKGQVDWAEFLPRYNVFGLSNSAYRAETLRRLPPAAGDSVAIDWSLATRAFCAGASMHFDGLPQMAYRQYDANVAKVVPPFSPSDVTRATEVVRAHYTALLDRGVPLPSDFRLRLDAARERLEKFRHDVVAQPKRLDRYVVGLNALEPCYVWWWCVANPDLEAQWRN